MCSGKFKGRNNYEESEDYYSSMEDFATIKSGSKSLEKDIMCGESDLYSSVDERAEIFIQQFYAELRMQSQQSSIPTISLLIRD